ncbi:MAG: cryptochrome/photolyase family protein [Synechococcaceae cyanobacterium]|nr:cryptochrome/photolyase family protein [Synechococcaceae cyanobacterium]
MSVGIWVLGDQLSHGQAALAAHDPAAARVVLIESPSVLVRRAHHRQRLVLEWSALRHFGGELRSAGWRVDVLEAESFAAGLAGWIHRRGITELQVMEPADRPVRRAIERILSPPHWCGEGVPPRLVWHPSNAFLWSREAFAAWARPRRRLRMETFYREGRRRFGVLMEGEGSGAEPLGGRWNFDRDNRRSPPKGLAGPPPPPFAPDGITAAVIAKVERIAADRESAGLAPLPGRSEPFTWPVTRSQALEALEHFIATRLEGFGPWQDAMVRGQPTLWHSLLSPSLNLGLLHPMEVIRRLEEAGRSLGTPPASLEGVIRQILGWREYTHGLYWWFGSDYPSRNHFGHHRPLPAFLERLGGSGMACMDSVLAELEASGYAHHIQRLMVLANYGLIAGLQPAALTAWFHRLFIDGYDWVMQTNVIGMGLFADGGLLASKPYAASGSYIRRMSDYCRGCAHDVKRRSGPGACPYNALYWDFLARHRETLRTNPRMALMMKQLERIAPGELAAIRATAAEHRRVSALLPAGEAIEGEFGDLAGLGEIQPGG